MARSQVLEHGVEDLGHPRNAQHHIPAQDKHRRLKFPGAAVQVEQKACLFSVQTQQENVAFAEREFGKFPLQEEILLQQEVMTVSGANVVPKLALLM